MTASRNLNVRITEQCCISCFERIREIHELGNYMSAFVEMYRLFSD